MATPTRDLKVQFLGDAKSLIRAADQAKKALDQSEAAVKKNDKAMGLLKKGALALGGVFAASQVTSFIKSATSAAIQQEEAERKVAATIKSMNAETWTSVDALKKQASAFQDTTTYGDEAVLGLQDILLTFGNIKDSVGAGNDIFTQTTGLALDMSTALGQDLKSSAIQLGKALNDPVVGVSALQRVGVSFTQQQKDQIKAMANSNDLLGAQKLILGELEKQFGGTAEAVAETAGGQIQQAMNKLGDIMEELGATLLPVVVDGLNNIVGPAQAAADAFVDMTTAARQAGLEMRGMVGDDLAGDIASAERAAADLAAALADGEPRGRALAEALATVAREGDLSGASINVLQDEVDATGLQMSNAAQMAIDLADELGLTQEQIEDLAFYAGQFAQRADDMTDAERDNASETERFRRHLKDATEATEDMGDATEDTTLSLIEQREAMLKLTNPVYALNSAQRTLAEAQAEVTRLQEEGKEGTDEYRDAVLKLVKANGEQQVAMAEVTEGMTGGGGSIAAFRDMAEAAGISKDIIDDIIQSILRYNETDLNEKTFVFRVAGGGGTVKVTGGNTALASGGVVMPVPGGADVKVAEGGDPEAVIPLNDAGARFMQNALGGNGNGAPVNITVNGFVGSEQQLAAEIDRLLTRRARTSGLGFR